MRNLFTFAALLLLALAVGCNKEDQLELDRKAIERYLTDHNLSATEHESGMFYIIDEPGSGGSPMLEDTVTVRYKATYLDDVVLDETVGSETASFQLNDLIAGWRIGIPLLQKEGKGTFFIPSYLAYGGTPPQGVRPNAPLRFDIELVDFHF